MAQLKVAQQKFGDSKENVKKLNNKESGGFVYNFFYLIVLFPYKLFDWLDFFFPITFVQFLGKDILVPLTSSVSFLLLLHLTLKVYFTFT